MNPRQRRGVLLIGLSAVGAIAVFLSVSSFVADVRSQVGPMISVLRLTIDAPADQPVTADMVDQVDMPERWAPAGALRDAGQLAGVVAASTLPGGSLLQEGMLVPVPELAEGEREIAILVDAETGVAGKIGPGMIVDIFATFPGDQESAPLASVVVERARIIDVGVVTTEQAPDASGSLAEGEVLPVTFALPIDDSLRLAYIESFATKVRLALRAPGDAEEIEDANRTYAPQRGEAGDAGDGGSAPAPPEAPLEPPPDPGGPAPASQG